MASQPPPEPDHIDPQSPPETPPAEPQPGEPRPDEIMPPEPDRYEPDRAPGEWPEQQFPIPPQREFR
jgi:hypothetical protein